LLHNSALILGEDTDDGHLHILLLAMCLVHIADDNEREKGEQNEHHVPELAALLPGGNLCWVSFSVVVLSAAVQPVTVWVNMIFLQVAELVKGVVLQVVSDDLVLLLGLGLICVHFEVANAGRFIGNLVFGVKETIALAGGQSLSS